VRTRWCNRGYGSSLFSTGKDREATEILVDHTMLVSPGADRQEMLKYREFESDKLEYWSLTRCNISKLPPSFGALVCSGDLYLSHNKLESLPKGFSEISVAGGPWLRGNPLEQLPDAS
jgi:hypothetical protein